LTQLEAVSKIALNAPSADAFWLAMEKLAGLVLAYFFGT